MKAATLLALAPCLLFGQADSSLQSKRLRFTFHQLLVPVSTAATGILVNSSSEESFKREVAELRQSAFPHFKTSADNYLQISPLIIAYGLDVAGVQSKTDFGDRAAITLKGEIFMLACVDILKNVTRELRPDGSARNSFPSGHTAQAFAGATLLSEEYKDRISWMPYSAYGLASTVGIMRMANNRHYISDVLVGAGLGIFSMKMAYWTHQYKWARKKHTVASV
jgi:hypothetical protein